MIIKIKYLLIFSFLLLHFKSHGQDWNLVVQLKGQWKFNIGDNPKWAGTTYDDSDWENLMVPSPWEDQGFHGYDGYAWYRKTLDGARLSEYKSHYLVLGYIDDVDQVFFNGHLIGASGSFPPNFSTAYRALRRYLIPQEYINLNNINTIAIRVFDATNVGGIVSGDVGIYSPEKPSYSFIDLQGLWAFSKGDKPIYKDRYFNDKDWKEILVPSPWENQGIGNYDGYAWYRKKFRPDPANSGEKMVLILGKIDDFDEVFVNGTFVGSTNDKQQFGASYSYLQVRIYHLPEGILIPNQVNTIAVRVYDLGHSGGIYEGPIGLIKETDLSRFLIIK